MRTPCIGSIILAHLFKKRNYLFLFFHLIFLFPRTYYLPIITYTTRFSTPPPSQPWQQSDDNINLRMCGHDGFTKTRPRYYGGRLPWAEVAPVDRGYGSRAEPMPPDGCRAAAVRSGVTLAAEPAESARYSSPGNTGCLSLSRQSRDPPPRGSNCGNESRSRA